MFTNSYLLPPRLRLNFHFADFSLSHFINSLHPGWKGFFWVGVWKFLFVSPNDFSRRPPAHLSPTSRQTSANWSLVKWSLRACLCVRFNSYGKHLLIKKRKKRYQLLLILNAVKLCSHATYIKYNPKATQYHHVLGEVLKSLCLFPF